MAAVSSNAQTDKQPAYVVGIDPSISNTGLVVLSSDGELELYKNISAFDKNGHISDTPRFDAQADEITDYLLPYDENFLAVYEDYSYNSVHRAYSLAEFNGILKAYLWQIYLCEPMLIAPTLNKKFATGFGQADKQMIINAALKECGRFDLSCEKITSDVCDAYFLALLGWFALYPELAAEKYKGHELLRNRLEIAKKSFSKYGGKNVS